VSRGRLNVYKPMVFIGEGGFGQFPSTNRFETTFSPWFNAGQIDWDRFSSEELSPVQPVTGPSAAQEGNYYIYVDASSPNYPNKTAILWATFNFSTAVIADIDFWYHMYGENMGSLYLEASNDSGDSWKELWSQSGNQGNQWLQENVDLSDYAGRADVQIRFRGVTGSAFMSDIALDSIVINAGPSPFDIDSDGLPNWWETRHFGGETNANADAVSSNGVNTLLEAYVIGFDPTDPSTEFVISDFRSLPSENILQWQSVTGRLYTVYRSDDLLDGFDLLSYNITRGAFTDLVHEVKDQGFYRLEVEVAP